MRNIAAKFFDNASRLSYELGLHGEKKKSVEILEYYKKWT